MPKPNFIERILDRFIKFELDLPKTEPPAFVPPAFVPPAFVPPAFVPPVFVPPAFVPPAFVPPAFVPPAFVPPVFVPPAFVPPAFVPPAFVPPVFVPPAFVPPVFVPPAFVPPAFVPPVFVPPAFVPPAFVAPDFPKTEPPVHHKKKLPISRLPILVTSFAKTSPPKQKFPILRLPFVAQKNVLWMLKLNDLIPLSFLSKRSKQMIKQALPSKKAQYDCRVWSREVSRMYITSRFGSYNGFEPNLSHIMELLSYPPIRFVVDSESVVTKAAEWIEAHQHCVKKVSFLDPKNHKMTSEFDNPFFDAQLDRNMSINRSEEEIRIENPDISLIHSIWRLNCRKIRLTSEKSSIHFLANLILFDWVFGENYESSIIEQLIFEWRGGWEKIDWKPENPGEKSEEDLEHPIYGTINEWYRIHGFNETKEAIVFKTHHNGNQVMVLNIQRIFGVVDR